MTAIDALRPSIKRYTLIYDGLWICAGSIFVGLMAQVAVPLPFSPVPLTGQTLAALLIGALLGSRRGVLALALYLGQGLLGVPVFAGGSAGLLRLVGPTGGYLVGLVVAAYVVGLLAERGWDSRPQKAFAAMLLGNALIYACGLLWLGRFVPGNSLLAAGLWPFVLGDLLKMALATVLLPAAAALTGRNAGN